MKFIDQLKMQYLYLHGNKPEQERFGYKFARFAKRAIERGAKMTGNEVRETREMAQSFFRILENKLNLNDRDDPPTEEEVREAIEQLKDVGRFSLFATVSILPGGGVSLIGLEILARKFGIDNFSLVPSSFREKGGSTDT